MFQQSYQWHASAQAATMQKTFWMSAETAWSMKLCSLQAMSHTWIDTVSSAGISTCSVTSTRYVYEWKPCVGGVSIASTRALFASMRPSHCATGQMFAACQVPEERSTKSCSLCHFCSSTKSCRRRMRRRIWKRKWILAAIQCQSESQQSSIS